MNFDIFVERWGVATEQFVRIWCWYRRWSRWRNYL